MKAFIYRNICVKGFFSETGILGARSSTFFKFLLLAEICVFGLIKEGQFAPKILVSEKNPFTHKFLN